MKIALVHDDLVQWGGAERVLLAMSEVFPEAPIYTSLFDTEHKILKDKFKDKKVITSFLQKIPQKKLFYKTLLPLYPISFELFDFSEFDLVVSQTTRFAKGILTKPTTKHICYCHTPPRFLYRFSGETPPSVLAPYLKFLKYYDQISAHRPDQYWAGSVNAQSRIKDIYNQESKVLYPFVETEKFANAQPFNGGYYLIIARLANYKKVDLAIKAFNENGLRLKVVGVGGALRRLQSIASANVELLGAVSEKMLVNLLSGCKALIITAEEDFGMTSLEAQILGKPVIAYQKGGALETVVENKTGVFFKEQTVSSLQEAIEKLETIAINPKECRENARQFSVENFKKNLRSLLE